MPIPHDSAPSRHSASATHGHLAAAPDGDDGETDRADDDAGDLRRRRQLAQHAGGDQDREDDLGLEHQGGETGRHPGVHRDVEEAELAQRHEDPDRRDHPPRRVRAADEEDRREDHEREPDRHEQQRRDAVHPPVDHHEVEAPDGGDEGGEEGVTAVHADQPTATRPCSTSE